MLGTYYQIKNEANRVRQIDLISILKLTGCVQDKYDKAKWHTSQGTISVSGTKFMNFTKGIGGGGAIDLVIHLQNLNFKTAVLWLAGIFPSYESSQITPKPLKHFLVPQKDDTKLPQVVSYLTRVRSIPCQLIKSLINSGRLYADNKGNAVFILLGKEKIAVGAELRGTTHVRWTGMAPGSKKSLGYFFVGSSKPRKMVLCESAIDAISFFALYPNSLAISTSGATPNPAWLKSFIKDGYDIYCGFDSDDTGERVAKKMIALYPIITRLRPGEHDWNEALISKLKK